jgi:hypothetical protein
MEKSVEHQDDVFGLDRLRVVEILYPSGDTEYERNILLSVVFCSYFL